MLLLFLPQGTNSAELDLADALADAVYRLGFASAADLIEAEAWVTVDELYGWADEAVKRIAYRTGLFVTYDASIAVEAGTGEYAQPASHVFTVSAALDGAVLRMASVQELWALDSLWQSASGKPKRVSQDAGALGTITLYPCPTASGTLAQVMQSLPAQVEDGASVISLPTVLQDYFAYAMLAGARAKESDAAMPEMAGHYRQRMTMYEAVMEHLWGPGG